MTKLDRYILRQYLTNFVILLVVFVVLFIVVDAIAHFDEFARVGQDHGIGIVYTLWDYYAPVVPFLLEGLDVAESETFAPARSSRQCPVLFEDEWLPLEIDRG